MSLSISTTPRRFRRGHTYNPGAYGSSTIYNGGANADIPCGDLDARDVIRIMQTNAITGSAGPLIEVVASRIHGNNGQFSVSTPDGSTVGADTNFDWFITKW
jgi:hypothetical protein